MASGWNGFSQRRATAWRLVMTTGAMAGCYRLGTAHRQKAHPLRCSGVSELVLCSTAHLTCKFPLEPLLLRRICTDMPSGRAIMRTSLIWITIAGALFLPAVASGQQSLPTEPPPNPHEVVPDQRLENVQQRLLVAAEQLKGAADSSNQSHAQQAFHYAHATIDDVRDVFDDLPQERRIQYEQALLEAEQALATGDPRLGAQAMQTLEERIRELVQRGA